MITLNVDLGTRSYPIQIGAGALKEAGKTVRRFAVGNRVGIVTNAKVNRLYGARCVRSLERAGFDVSLFTIPDGEKYKTVDTVYRIYDRLVQHRFDRSDTVFALGGGVTGDIAGFAASTYMRGIAYVQAPTTLLSQVDSSVGGKTGVDHPGGKNIIGAFYQPKAVLADLGSLDTLSDREFRCGMAEVVKYGIIQSAAFFRFLEASVASIMKRNRKALEKIVKESCRIKARIVVRDEREAGLRALLNMGHTFAHGIETALGFRAMKHGEAVAVGMVMAARLSHRLGLLAASAVERLRNLLSAIGLPTRLPKTLAPSDVLEGMRHDKKKMAGAQRYVLFDRIGRGILCSDISAKEISLSMK